MLAANGHAARFNAYFEIAGGEAGNFSMQYDFSLGLFHFDRHGLQEFSLCLRPMAYIVSVDAAVALEQLVCAARYRLI